jgi:hypothetical protein
MRLQMGYNLDKQQMVFYHQTFSNFQSFQPQIELFYVIGNTK